MQERAKYLAMSVSILALACAISAYAQKGGGGKAGETTGYGNNLSYPVLFAEGYGIGGAQIPSDLTWGTTDPELSITVPDPGDATGLRPSAADTTYTAFPWLVEPYAANPDYYAQNTVNTWRAQWELAPEGPSPEVQVDWGDNLISQSWTATQPVRVETVLRQPVAMIGYPMASLLGSRRTETQGTTGEPALSLGRTVYSITAHLMIEKIGSDGQPVENGCSVDKTVYTTAGDGPGNYAAEINVSGALIYGYNWMLSQCSAAPDTTKEGNWRVTFQLDPVANLGVGGSVSRNAVITGVADISSPITTVSWDGEKSWLDIKIVSSRPTGGKGKPQ